MMLDDDTCCVCGVDPSKKASNLTKRTLLSNISRERRCGHRFCNACVERNVQKKGQFACPVANCGAKVRKATLDPRTLEEIEVERDATHRKRVLGVFNAPAESFESARAYDDYLEEVEDAIFQLSRGGPGAEAVERKLQAHAAANSDSVAKQTAAKIERDRVRAAEIEDDTARSLEAAAKLREKRRLEKKKKADDAEHAMAFALGDRVDAPVLKPRKIISAAVLPAPIGRPTNPRVVTGEDLEKRKAAGGWDPEIFSKRAAHDMYFSCDAAGLKKQMHPPPYAAPTLYFGQRAATAPKKIIRAKIVKSE